MGFLARPGFSFFVLFFTVITLGLRQFHSASATRHISFRFLFGYHFRKEREKKIRENPEKKQLHRLTAVIGKTKETRINTGI